MGCLQPLSTRRDRLLRCTFEERGFPFLDGARARPCHTTYHVECFRAGAPFKSRRKNGDGLSFPPVQHWPTFICESCTVRAVLDRELHSRRDVQLLMLERMSILDKVWSLARSTFLAYQSKLAQVTRFEQAFGVKILQASSPSRPPSGPEVSLLWCQEAFSLKASHVVRNQDQDRTLSFTTIRQFRSAVGHYQLTDLVNTNPTGAYLNRSRQLVMGPGRGTDSVAFTTHAAGMSSRLGTHTQPSVALEDRHVRFLDNELDLLYATATTDEARREIALAGFANVALWIYWFRSREAFDSDWESISIGTPHPLDHRDPLRQAGFVKWALNYTKTHGDKLTSTIGAYTTRSGYRLGIWAERARSFNSVGPVFCHPSGERWTSLYFRRKYLYPSLYRQQALGDPALETYTMIPGNRIEDKYWSLHCYRRGARSNVSLRRIVNGTVIRKASATHVYVHGRWSVARSNEPIDKQYLQWTDWHRLQITLWCC